MHYLRRHSLRTWKQRLFPRSTRKNGQNWQGHFPRYCFSASLAAASRFATQQKSCSGRP